MPDERRTVGGVDTHRDEHTAAAVDLSGRLLATASFPTTRAGYGQLLGWLRGLGGVELAGRPCCGGCGGPVWAHGSSRVDLADLPTFGRPVRLRWKKRRWRCPEAACSVGTFTDQHDAIALPRAPMTTRAAKHATRRAGLGRAIGEIAAGLGTSVGTVTRVARQLGCGVETVRKGVALAGTDAGTRAGVTSAEGVELKRLRQENRELRRANEIGQRAAVFSGKGLDRRQR